ncbi:antitoxin VapB family protein [Candidatus Micrarchaeota archaeon]|nr:antitoxin VapB family protein [Candidatus Micrarchaeota archaeon]
MANVYLTDEAYARLKAAKKEGQSFSDWVKENAKPHIDWDQFVGCCKDMDIDKAMAEMKKERRRYL